MSNALTMKGYISSFRFEHVGQKKSPFFMALGFTWADSETKARENLSTSAAAQGKAISFFESITEYASMDAVGPSPVRYLLGQAQEFPDLSIIQEFEVGYHSLGYR